MLPKALSVDETARLLAPVDDDDHVQTARDLAMFELFYSSGLRLAELVALDCDALDSIAHEGEVRVLGKRSKLRLVPVGSKARRRLPPGPHCAVSWPGRTSKPCSSASAERASVRAWSSRD
jgi:integrase/recombinase XerC